MSQGLYINLVRTTSLLKANFQLRDIFEEKWGHDSIIDTGDIGFLEGVKACMTGDAKDDIDKIIDLLIEHEQLEIKIE